MNEKLFIPKKIKVGYQERSDTYTKMLAYVIYYDLKGKLCKEKSWRGWIHDQDIYNREWKDGKYTDTQVLMRKALPVHDFDNEPMSGFVLNKRAGGHSSGWNHRQMKCRVFDPRGFEFEISIENLLFILQETSSYKGKGLEGEFVYAWSGPDIVLLPTSCEDYTSSQSFTDLKTMKVSARDLVEGHTYLNKNTNEMVYIGKYEYINYHSWRKKFNISKEFMFYDLKEEKFLPVKATALAKVVDVNIIPNYAALVEQLQQSSMVKPFTINIIPKEVAYQDEYQKSYNESFNNIHLNAGRLFMKIKPDVYVNVYSVHGLFRKHDERHSWYGLQKPADPNEKKAMPILEFQLHFDAIYKIVGDEITQLEDDDNYRDYIYYPTEEFKKKEFFQIEMKFFNDKTKLL